MVSKKGITYGGTVLFSKLTQSRNKSFQPQFQIPKYSKNISIADYKLVYSSLGKTISPFLIIP